MVYSFPGGLLLILLGLFVFNSDLTKDVEFQKNMLRSSLFPQVSIASYPALQSTVDLQSFGDMLSAEAAVVMDDDSKVNLFEKNAQKRFSMASTTKIMTALIALSYYKLDDVLTVDTGRVEGSVVGFKTGEKVTVENLLYGMLLPSGNDTAYVLAQNYPGGVEAFVLKMNENAIHFHLTNTHFADPAGLADGGDYTTAIDLARLVSIALKNDTFSRIVATKLKTITDLNGNVYVVENLNKLLGIDGIDGVKTGFTDQARGILTTSRFESGHRQIIIVMKSQDRFLDTRKLLDMLRGNIIYQSIRL